MMRAGDKRNRLTASDSWDDDPRSGANRSPLRRTGPPTSYESYKPVYDSNSTMSAEPRRRSPPRGPSDYREAPREREDFRFTSDKSRLRDSRDRSSPPRKDGRYVSARFNERDRVSHSSPARPSLSKENTATNSLTSTPRSPHPDPPATSKNQVPAPPPVKSAPSKSLEMPPESVAMVTLESQEATTTEFRALFLQMFERSTDLAALTIQKRAAEKDFIRKDEEFKKGQMNMVHEKFPQTEETQRKNKDQAKKALVSISEKCKKQNVAIEEIAIKSFSLLPALVGAGADAGGQEIKKLQAQVDSFEKSCGALQVQLREQQTFIEELKKSREELESKHRDLAEDSRALTAEHREVVERCSGLEAKYQELAKKQSSLEVNHQNMAQTQTKSEATHQELLKQWHGAQEDLDVTKNRQVHFDKDMRPIVNGLDHKVSDLEKDIETLKLEMGSNMTRLSDLSAIVPLDLSQQLQKVSSHLTQSGHIDFEIKGRDISQLKEDIAQVKEALADNAKVSDGHRQKLDSLESCVRGPDAKGGLRGYITSLMQDQKAFRQDLLKEKEGRALLGERVKVVENLKIAATRIELIEKRLDTLPSNVDLVEIRKRIAAVESGLLGYGQKITTFESQTTSVQSKLDNMEKQVANIPDIKERVISCEKSADSYAEASTITDIRATLVDVKERLNSLQDEAASTKLSKGNSLGGPELLSGVEQAQQLLPNGPHLDTAAYPNLDQLIPQYLEKLIALEKKFNSVLDVQAWVAELKDKILPKLPLIEMILTDTKLPLLERTLPILEKIYSSAVQRSRVDTPGTGTNIAADHDALKQELLVILKPEILAAVQTHSLISDSAVKNLQTRVSAVEPLHANFQQLQLEVNSIPQRLANRFIQLDQLSTSQEAFNTAMATLEDRVEAVNHGIANIDQRLSNINTKEMALYIIQQLELSYPDARNAQNVVAEQKLALQKLSDDVTEMKEKLQSLIEGHWNPDSSAIQSLRAELSNLTDRLALASREVDEGKGKITALSDENKGLSGFFVQFTEVIKNRLDKLETQLQEQSNRAIPAYNENYVRGVHSSSTALSDRQHSGELGTKKRKISEPVMGKTNGKGVNSPTSGKRKKARFDIEVSDDDFEPQQPGVTFDEDASD